MQIMENRKRLELSNEVHTKCLCNVKGCKAHGSSKFKVHNLPLILKRPAGLIFSMRFKMRVLLEFEYFCLLFFRFSMGLIRIWVLFEGGSLLRIFGKYGGLCVVTRIVTLFYREKKSLNSTNISDLASPTCSSLETWPFFMAFWPPTPLLLPKPLPLAVVARIPDALVFLAESDTHRDFCPKFLSNSFVK